MTQAILVKWRDSRRAPRCAPNPDYPDGIDLDLARGAPSCSVALPYPAKRRGHFKVACRACGFTAVITTAGRCDDPRSAKLPCKGRTGRSN